MYYFQKVLHLWCITSKKYYIFDVILQKSITSLTYYYEVHPANNFKCCVDNSHFFRWNGAINHGTPRAFGGLLMMYPVDHTTKIHNNTQRFKERNDIPSSCWDMMVFPACPWFSMRIWWFWWKCDAAHWISTISSTKLHSLSLKEYSRDVVSGRFHYQSYFEVRSAMVMVIGRTAMERFNCSVPLYYGTVPVGYHASSTISTICTSENFRCTV